MIDCNDLLRPALAGLADEFEISRDDTSCKVVTPFQHPNGDLIRIWVQEREKGKYLIRDYGETHSMLRIYGVDPETDARKEYISNIGARFSLSTSGGEIKGKFGEDTVGMGVLNAIQAVLAVSYLIYTHQSQAPSRFRTKVHSFLEEHQYSFSEDYPVEGQTQRREFDFGINHREPKVLLDTIHAGQAYNLSQRADAIMLSWHEIQDTPYEYAAIVDDVDGVFDKDRLQGVIDNLDHFFRWTDRQAFTDEIPVAVE